MPQSNWNRSPGPAARPVRRERPVSTARPITFPPKVPASGKERKRMLKATAFRLGRLISVPCAVLVETDAAKLFLIVQSRFAGVRHDPDAGEARRLATKFLRLRHSTKA